jgi:hypothetical protein
MKMCLLKSRCMLDGELHELSSLFSLICCFKVILHRKFLN